nr:reverse transcriptase domain-containing protein [Tanacetum cinerariifolium]
METVFHIVENQTKFSTCTLLGSALTWRNSYVMTVGHDVAYAMTWPKTMQEGIEMATELMDKKIHTFAERQTENNRKQDDNNNQAQQQPLKKQGVAIAYTARPGEKKEYAGTLPLCNKCKFITMASAL